MPLSTLRDIDVEHRKVLVRADLDVPLMDDGSIADDRRIRTALPTLRRLMERGAAVVLLAHLGRPHGEPGADPRLRLDRVAARLRDVLDRPVVKVDEVIGDRARAVAATLRPGQILLLENVRFHPGEAEGDDELGRQLAALADAYVDDAFATSHLEHASVVAVPRRFGPHNRAIGLVVERELAAMDRLRGEPERPFVAVIGGGRVEEKIRAIRALRPRVDLLFVGGAVALTMLKAKGEAVGLSCVDDDVLDEARALFELDRDEQRLVLPTDHVVANGDGERLIVDRIPAGARALDLGPASVGRIVKGVVEASTVVWSGPVGELEDPAARTGTAAVARAIADGSGYRVVGGGETGDAVISMGLADRVDHVSTASRAFLHLLVHGSLAALDALGRDA